ncbi:GNAT family N-acetyltransferase [Rothia nasimurium]|uniref:GNAT family N-acetyltransferase n=1 Tax=Rothia nasimurium TaxID=85336 RepID=UPI003B9F6593
MLLKAEGFSQVQDRNTRYATGLVGDGYQWRAIVETDRQAVEEIVRANIAGSSNWVMPQNAGGIACLNSSQEIVAVAVIEAFGIQNKETSFSRPDTYVQVSQLAVIPTERGKGIGQVTLNMVEQLLENENYKWVSISGGCEPSAAKFYAQSGFNVLAPGEPLPWHRLQTDVMNSNPHYSATFYKTR